MKITSQELTKIRDYFGKKPEVVAVYLYGSFAKGEAKKDSDVDLGVVFSKEKRKKEKPFSLPQVVFADDLVEILKRKVEIQNLNACSVEFCHRVLSEGKLIFGRGNQERVSFEVQVTKKYFDLKPFIEEYYYFLSEITKKGQLDVRYPTH